MELDNVKKFVELVKNTDIEELRWENGSTKINFRRAKDSAALAAEALERELDEKARQQKDKDKAEEAAEEKVESPKSGMIKSPIVGRFFRSLTDRPPMVLEGDHITPGQKVGIIETMKLNKDVMSNVKGKIIKIMVENSSPVEYGQDLFEVEFTADNGDKIDDKK
ncbi:MAG: biotin/lipoyl-containing protein [Elusimicrobiota bacterium]